MVKDIIFAGTRRNQITPSQNSSNSTRLTLAMGCAKLPIHFIFVAQFPKAILLMSDSSMQIEVMPIVGWRKGPIRIYD